MNLQSLVVVLLRLVSLNFFLQVLFQIALQLPRFSLAFQISPEGARHLPVLPLMIVVGLILAAVLLWACAPSIARLVTRGLAAELSFGTMSLADCYSIVFIGLGLLFAVNNFAHVLNWIHYLLRMASRPGNDWKDQVQWYDFTQPLFSFIVGIVLFVNGRKWAVALARRQTENAPSLTPSNPPLSNEPKTP